MHFWQILPLVAILNLIVGFSVLRRDWRAKANWAFAGFMFSIGCWVFSDFLLMASGSEQMALLSEKFAHTAGILIAVSLWIFARLFTFHKTTKSEWFLISFSTVVINIITFWPSVLAKSVNMHTWGPEVIIQPFYHFIFMIFFFTFFLWGLYMLIMCSRSDKFAALQRRQARSVAIGISLAAIGGVFFNIILLSPLIDKQQFVWLGPMFSMLLVFCVNHTKQRDFFGIPKAYNTIFYADEHLFNSRIIMNPFVMIRESETVIGQR